MQESNWDPAVLQHAEPQMSEDEWRRFEAMGEITADEVIQFHYSLQRLSTDDEA